jgi:ribosome-interacting GTPase 1
MPTNLPGEAKQKWKEVFHARRPEDKIVKLQEFLSLVPKHKGTDKLRAQVTRKIATLRREIVEKKQKRPGAGRSRFFIKKEGDAQVVILGLTNVGRSSLLANLTNAKVDIFNYPYTTKEPTPGMFQYLDLQLQLIEAPALMNSPDGGAWDSQSLTLARNADGIILMIDLSRNPKEQFSLILQNLDKAGILTRKPRARVMIERTHTGAGLKVILLGSLLDTTIKDVEHLIKSYGIHDATIKIQGKATLDDVEDAIFEGIVYRPALVIANKIDIAPSHANEMTDHAEGEMRVIPVSCTTKINVERLGQEIFDMLDIVRVYTKEPNDKIHSMKPFTIENGSTIYDLAKRIHSDFYERFSYAKVWSPRLRFSPQKVGGTFVLEDGDIVEIHTK